MINKQQTTVLILQQNQKNQERAKCGTCGEKKIDQEDQLLKELTTVTSVNPPDIANFQLHKENLSPCFTNVTSRAKSDFKKPIDVTGLILNLKDKALGIQSRSNHGNETILNTANLDEQSSTIIELHAEETKSNYSSVFSKSSLQKITQTNYNSQENVKKPYNIEIQDRNDVIQKLGVLSEIDTTKSQISSDVLATKKKSGKFSKTNKRGKKCIDNYSTRDNETLQGQHSLPMNQFGELHAKVETKLNSNDLEKEHAHKSQEIETPSSEEKTMSSLQNYRESPSHLNFECDAGKITVDVSSNRSQHLVEKVKTKTNFLDSYKHKERVNLCLGYSTNKIKVEVTKTPSQTQAKMIKSETSRFDQHSRYEHESESEYFNTIKRQPTDGKTPESQSKTKYAKPQTDEPILDTKIIRHMLFVDIIEVLMMRNQFYRSKGWPEPTNLLRSSPSYNVYPRQQRTSKHFKWLLQTSKLEHERQAYLLRTHPFLTKQGKHLNKFTTKPESRPTLQQTESLSTEDIIMPLCLQNQHDRRYVSENFDCNRDADRLSVNVSNKPSQLLIHEIKTKSQTQENQAEPVDQYDEYEPEQQPNNTLDFQQSDLPAIRPFIDFKMPKNMPQSEILQLIRMRNQYLDTKEHLESGEMTKTSTDSITPTLPRGPCQPGRYRLARICPKCPTKPSDSAPLRKLCDPWRSNTCPKHCDKKFEEAKDAIGILTQNFRSNISPKMVIGRDCEVRPLSAEMETLKEPDSGLAFSQISDSLSMKIDSQVPIPNFPFNIQSLFPKCPSINSVPKRVLSYENPKKRITDSRESLKNSSSFEWSD